MSHTLCKDDLTQAERREQPINDNHGSTNEETVDLGSLGVVWKIEGFESEGRFSVVEHPIPPRTLAAPLHLHHREDEYFFREVAAVFADAKGGEPGAARFAQINERYELDMDFDSVPRLCERFGLGHPLR